MNDLWHLNVNRLTDNVRVIGCFKGCVLENSIGGIIRCQLNDNGRLHSFQLDRHTSVILNLSDFCDIHIRHHSVTRECVKYIRWEKNNIVNPIWDYNRFDLQSQDWDTNLTLFFRLTFCSGTGSIYHQSKYRNLYRFSSSVRNLGHLTAILVAFGTMER